jgi:acetyl-CoA C-acetyltransferase
MAEAYIVEALRTAGGRRGGKLAKWHPADMAGEVLSALAERSGIDPAAVEDVILGCVSQVGEQSFHIGRNAVLASRLPDSVPAVSIDRQCGSSQQAVHFAAQAVMSGTSDLVVAGGTQSMSQIPIAYSSREAALPLGLTEGPYAGSIGWRERYGDQPVTQFYGAELIAEKWGISREDMERFALQSHQRAARAIDEGRFDREIAPYGEVQQDEGPRRDTTLEKMAELKPLTEGGRLTAAVSSQVSDGASAMLIASERAVAEYGLTPRARVHHLSVRGEDPIRMLSAPIPATAYALKKAGMSIDDMDLVEINEAFAPVVLAWLKETGADPARVNVNGGAIALGHPLGATGVKLMTTLLHELERTGGRYGLQTMCEGGGQANVTIIERL